MGSSDRVRKTSLVAVGLLGLGAATLGFAFYFVYNDEVYWNLNNDHRWYYIHPALYGATASLGILAIISGARGVRSPAQILVRILPWALAEFILLTLWACASTAMALADLV
jgi:hypothetical protein